MEITAKYGGLCSICGDGYTVGDKVWWDKEEKTCAHMECFKDDKIDDAGPIKPVQTGTSVRMSNELVVKMVLKAALDLITVHGQCKILSGHECTCAKCQIERLDPKEIAKKVWG